MGVTLVLWHPTEPQRRVPLEHLHEVLEDGPAFVDEAGRVTVSPTDTTHGTFVKGELIAEPREIRPGEIVRYRDWFIRYERGHDRFAPRGEAEEALWSALRARPDDRELRQVYADWLEEHGHTREAEVLRIDIDGELSERRVDFRLRRLTERLAPEWSAIVHRPHARYRGDPRNAPYSSTPPPLGCRLFLRDVLPETVGEVLAELGVGVQEHVLQAVEIPPPSPVRFAVVQPTPGDVEVGLRRYSELTLRFEAELEPIERWLRARYGEPRHAEDHRVYGAHWLLRTEPACFWLVWHATLPDFALPYDPACGERFLRELVEFLRTGADYEALEELVARAPNEAGIFCRRMFRDALEIELAPTLDPFAVSGALGLARPEIFDAPLDNEWTLADRAHTPGEPPRTYGRFELRAVLAKRPQGRQTDADIYREVTPDDRVRRLSVTLPFPERVR